MKERKKIIKILNKQSTFKFLTNIETDLKRRDSNSRTEERQPDRKKAGNHRTIPSHSIDGRFADCANTD